MARPTVMTTAVVGKLEEAFELGCTDVEACLHAGIHKDSLYEYQKLNPKFTDRKEALKESPTYKARKKVVESLEENAELSLKYLERKKKDEFSPRTDLKHQGDPDNPLQTNITVEFTKSHQHTQERCSEILENEEKK